MIESVEGYLAELKDELDNSDPAIRQDALADAEQHLRESVKALMDQDEIMSRQEAVQRSISKYGSPEEIAEAYLQISQRSASDLTENETGQSRSLLFRFFAVISEPRAWGALLYLLLSLATGTLYFSWAVTGLGVSLGFMILIIGLPVTVLVLLSFRTLALLEGRLVEALLGVRMPRRPVFSRRDENWKDQVKRLFTEGRTWRALAYLLLHLPLGTVYFLVFFVLLTLSTALVATPILEWILDVPLIRLGEVAVSLQPWQRPLFIVAGLLAFVVTLHLAKLVGRWHGRLAKGLLVSRN